MALIFSQNSGLNDDFWKPVAQVIKSVMQDTDTEKTQYDKLVTDVCVEEKSKKYAEKSTGITSTGTFQIVNEGDVPAQSDIQETFPKLIVHSTFMDEIACTKQMKDDGDINVMKTMSRNMVMGYKRTRAELATRAIATEGAKFSMGDRELDKTTGDGQALFSTAHPGKKAGVATQSNVYTNAFGTDTKMLNRLANIGRNFKNNSGEIQGYTFDTIIIPGNCPEMEDLIKRIIRSDLIVGSSNNDVNTQKGLWNLVVLPTWQVASGKAPYIIMSKEACKELRGTVFFDRVGLDVRNWVDNHSRNLLWNAYCRMSCGFNDWRHLILGGADAGTTLT